MFVDYFCVFLLSVIDGILYLGLTAGVCCCQQVWSERLTFLGSLPVTLWWLQATLVGAEQSAPPSGSTCGVSVAPTGCLFNSCGSRGHGNIEHRCLLNNLSLLSLTFGKDAAQAAKPKGVTAGRRKRQTRGQVGANDNYSAVATC